MNDRNFFATCTFCRKPNQFITFCEEWKGQTSSNGTWVKKGNVWLCSPCANRYGLSTLYEDKVKLMCEVLDGKR